MGQYIPSAWIGSSDARSNIVSQSQQRQTSQPARQGMQLGANHSTTFPPIDAAIVGYLCSRSEPPRTLIHEPTSADVGRRLT